MDSTKTVNIKKRRSKLLGDAYDAAVKQTMDKLTPLISAIIEDTKKNKGNSKYLITIIKNTEYNDGNKHDE